MSSPIVIGDPVTVIIGCWGGGISEAWKVTRVFSASKIEIIPASQEEIDNMVAANGKAEQIWTLRRGGVWRRDGEKAIKSRKRTINDYLVFGNATNYVDPALLWR